MCALAKNDREIYGKRIHTEIRFLFARLEADSKFGRLSFRSQQQLKAVHITNFRAILTNEHILVVCVQHTKCSFIQMCVFFSNNFHHIFFFLFHSTE